MSKELTLGEVNLIQDLVSETIDCKFYCKFIMKINKSNLRIYSILLSLQNKLSVQIFQIRF